MKVIKKGGIPATIGCKFCFAELEIVPKDVKHVPIERQHPMMDGCKDYDYVVCPECKSKIDISEHNLPLAFFEG